MAEKETGEQVVDKTEGGAAAADTSGKSAAQAGADGASDGGDPSPPSTEGSEGGEKASVGADSPPADKADPAKVDQPKADPEAWKAKKYDKVYAKLKATEAELAAAKAAPAPGADGKPALTEAEVESRANAKAALAEFNRHCNEVASKAASAFPDFKDRIGNFKQLVTDPEDQVAYNQLVSSALELGDEEAGKVLYALGGNLDEAARIMALRPAKQGIELAKLAAAKGEPEPSQTPKPLTPVGQRGATGEQIKPEDPTRADKLSTREWMARRAADIEKKRQSGVRIW